jgi:hypothetical protein
MFTEVFENEGEMKCTSLSWDLTFDENHWLVLKIMKEVFHKIWLPY